MSYKLKQNGFSLAEVLMASAILAVGLLMIAGTFPVAIFLTADSVEQTIAPIVADEAFAKIQLYSNINVGAVTGKALDLYALATGTTAQRDFVQDFNSAPILPAVTIMQGTNVYFSPSAETVYPSVTAAGNSSPGTYSWAALCRKIVPYNSLDPSYLKDTQVQVTVFVSRKTGGGLKYLNQADSQVDLPTPVTLGVTPQNGNIVRVDKSYLTDGCAIVADKTGNIFRVLERAPTGGTSVDATLDRTWNFSANGDGSVGWIIPPPVNSNGVCVGRSPVIGVYQRIIRF
jgi:prepilin-type N-terminal cleavage/methylation domain-containing protein